MTLALSQLKAMVERATDSTSDAREASERDRDYYDGFQWTAEERAVLEKRKQPVITVNRIKRKIDAMVGIEQRGRVDPVAYPRNPQDEAAADIATKALRFVEEKCRLDRLRSDAFENLLVEGYGGIEIIAEEQGGQIEVVAKRLRWEEIFFDPHSREKDFSDAQFLGVLKWMSLDAAVAYASRFYQGEDLEAIIDTGTSGATGETYEDRPMREGQMAWADKRQRRVRVCQMYYQRDGIWHLAIFTGRGELYHAESPYLDEMQRPTCPIILMSGYVDRENRRYGLVRDMIPMQDEINKRRSKLLHSLNSRQTMGIKGAVSVETLKRELAKPDGHIEVDIDAADGARDAGVPAFQILQNQDQTRGQYELLVEAKQEIDMLGPNASLIGQLEGQQSGRAIMAQQNAGMAELAPIYDSLRDWTERVYRATWNRIRQFWTGPRWIRITEDENAAQFVGLNQPVMGEWGPQIVNPVAEIDVDIIVDQAPDYATLRAEQFDKIAEMAGKGVPIPPQALIEASDLRDKKKIVEAMQGDPQLAQAQQQAAQRNAMAEIGVKETQAERNRAAAMKDMASIGKVQAEAEKVAVETVLKPLESALRAMPRAM
jgi:hypothetical protein